MTNRLLLAFAVLSMSPAMVTYAQNSAAAITPASANPTAQIQQQIQQQIQTNVQAQAQVAVQAQVQQQAQAQVQQQVQAQVQQQVQAQVQQQVQAQVQQQVQAQAQVAVQAQIQHQVQAQAQVQQQVQQQQQNQNRIQQRLQTQNLSIHRHPTTAHAGEEVKMSFHAPLAVSGDLQHRETFANAQLPNSNQGANAALQAIAGEQVKLDYHMPVEVTSDLRQNETFANATRPNSNQSSNAVLQATPGQKVTAETNLPVSMNGNLQSRTAFANNSGSPRNRLNATGPQNGFANRVSNGNRLAEISQLRDRAIAQGDAAMMAQADRMEASINSATRSIKVPASNAGLTIRENTRIQNPERQIWNSTATTTDARNR